MASESGKISNEEDKIDMGVEDTNKMISDREKKKTPKDKILRFLKYVKSLGKNQDNPDQHTVLGLVMYLVFLMLLCIITFGMISPDMYYFTKVMTELFLDTKFEDTKNTFRGMTTMQDFWRFAEGPLLDGLYWETWYNQRLVSREELGYVFYENKLLGLPRIRQLKVLNDSCTVHEDFENNIRLCFDSYSSSIEDRSSFGPFENTNLTAWVYQTEDIIGGSPHRGLISTYGGGGFIQNLGANKTSAQNMLNEMKRNLWLDRGSRVVFIDFSVYNANINLFCVVRLIVELPPTGGAIPSHSFRTVKLIRYASGWDYFVLTCEIFFFLFVLYYVFEEGMDIKTQKLLYFTSFWNVIDVIIIILAFFTVTFNIYRSTQVATKLEEYLTDPESYIDIEFLSYWHIIFNSVLAIMLFLAWIKIFKYIKFNKTMIQLYSTLTRCAKDVVGFALMFFIIFLAFAQLGYLIFGTQVRDFSSFDAAFFTLFRIILGDFDYHELEEANRVLGPIYFLLYVFFVFFVLLNMFLAIINDTYSEVKTEMESQEIQFNMAEYFKENYNKMLENLNIKKDKIDDIKHVLQTASTKEEISYTEFKEDFLKRGYDIEEIKTVFTKYDLDKNHVLNKNEQDLMILDLQEQHEALKIEYEEIHEKKMNIESEGNEGITASDHNMVSKAAEMKKFYALTEHVNKIEGSVKNMTSKIDSVVRQLQSFERVKSKRKGAINDMLDTISKSEDITEYHKRLLMEKLIRDELANMK